MPDRRRLIFGYALALGLGLIGGAIADFIDAPLPWFIGPMVLNTVVALAGAPLLGPNFLRPVAMPILGVVLGATFLPEIFANIGQWALPLGMIPVFIVLSTSVNYAFFRRVGGQDPTTAYLSSVPGGLTDMILLGEEYGGDTRQIALAHSLRVLTAVMSIALLVVSIGDPAREAIARPIHRLTDIALPDALIQLACAVFGPFAGKLLRLPARHMLGAIVLSAIVHLTGLSKEAPPTVISYAAQLILGTSVGARFAGVSFSSAATSMLHGFLSSVIALVVSAGMAMVAFGLAGLNFHEALLGYAPGGMMEMSLLALAIHQSVAYVTVAHILRYVIVMFTAVVIFKAVRRRA